MGKGNILTSKYIICANYAPLDMYRSFNIVVFLLPSLHLHIYQFKILDIVYSSCV